MIHVNVEPVREHVRHLMAANIGADSIADRAGVSRSTVNQILYYPPRRRVSLSTAQRLLAVKVELDAYPDRSQVDGTITRRKLEALIAIGWSLPKLAIKLGLRRQHVWTMLNRQTVSARRARLVRDLFVELWNTPPPVSTVLDQVTFTRALDMADEHGYRKPMDWDNIDDLNEQPLELDPTYVDEVLVRRVIEGKESHIKLSRAEKREAARIMVKVKGWTPSAVGSRLGMGYHTVKKVVGVAA